MHMLYDSASFVVVHMLPLPDAPDASGGAPDKAPVPQLLRHGFEIVDKRSGKEVYLDGSWAELFQQQIMACSRTPLRRTRWKPRWTVTRGSHRTPSCCTEIQVV